MTRITTRIRNRCRPPPSQCPPQLSGFCTVKYPGLPRARSSTLLQATKCCLKANQSDVDHGETPTVVRGLGNCVYKYFIYHGERSLGLFFRRDVDVVDSFLPSENLASKTL
jgi:hypothetical protein